MKNPAFRHPKQMGRDTRTPVSTRIKERSKEQLEKAAKKHGISLALLLANIVDDYADWLEKEGG